MADITRGGEERNAGTDLNAGRGGGKNANHWSNWKAMPTGHGQASAVMQAVSAYANEFFEELTSARREWEDALKECEKAYKAVASEAKKNYEKACKAYQKEYNANVANANRSLEPAAELVDACNRYTGKVAKKGADAARYAMNSGIGAVEQSRNNLQRAVKMKLEAYRDLCTCQMAEAAQRCTAVLSEAAKKQKALEGKTNQIYYAKQNNICRTWGGSIAAALDAAALERYSSKIAAARFNAETYSCPTTIPEIVMLGTIGVSIPVAAKDGALVAKAVKTAVPHYSKENKSEYVFELPYAQRLNEGISLLIRHHQKDSGVQKLLQPILLKLFMSFPPGRMEATIIDPLQFGGNFSEITRLASAGNAERIINTKIWQREEDIENALSVLHQRLEYLSHAYHNDSASRLKKEPLKALAITDFPVGFTDKALKDLHAIVRNSAALGVCVLICANEEEFSKLRERNAILADEISQSVIETRAEGKRLILVGTEQDRIRTFIRVDEMPDVMKRKDTIIPLLREKIDVTPIKIEYFENMYGGKKMFDRAAWFNGPKDKLAVPIGIIGKDDLVKLTLGRNGTREHHALITGQSGSGKSTLLHTLITSALLSYRPEELQMYLLDFKEGVEFINYTRFRLPSLRTVAIHSSREFGLAVLKELYEEWEIRSREFRRYNNIEDIYKYNGRPDVEEKMPRIVMIFDEVQELFSGIGDPASGEGDSVVAECLDYLGKLVEQGRAMGINVILACQDFRNCPGLERCFSQMAIRIAVKSTEDGASSILSPNNQGVEALRNEPVGSAIYNNNFGDASANTVFQVCKLESDVRERILTELDSYYSEPEQDARYKDLRTRILLSNAEYDANNAVNTLIRKGPDSCLPMRSSEDGFGLLLGQSDGSNPLFIKELRTANADNLLIAAKNERTALSLFMFSAISILYESLFAAAPRTGPLIYLFDISANNTLRPKECGLEGLHKAFPEQIVHIGCEGIERRIRELYEILNERKNKKKPAAERIFVLFFGLDRARVLIPGSSYGYENNGVDQPAVMLREILQEGPLFGINSVVWCKSTAIVSGILGENFASYFSKRIAEGLTDEIMLLSLVAESDPKSIRGNTAVYFDTVSDFENTRFRPYVIPDEVWVQRYAEAWNNADKKGGK